MRIKFSKLLKMGLNKISLLDSGKIQTVDLKKF